MKLRHFNLLLAFLLLPVMIACQAENQAGGAEEPEGTITPTSTSTPIPTPTSTPTPEPVFSYYTNGDNIVDIAIDSQGAVWAAGSGGVVRWDLETGQSTHFTRADGLPVNNTRAITTTADGSVWVVSQAGLVRYLDEKWTIYTVDDGLVSNFPVNLVAAEDGLWASFTSGVSFFDGQTWTSYTSDDGLLGSSFSDILIEPEGRVWVGSGEGVSWFENGEWNSKKIGVRLMHAIQTDHISVPESVVEDLSAAVLCISRAPDGAIWFGTDEGGARYANDTWSYFTKKEGIYLMKGFWDIAFDGSGRPWGVEHGRGVYHYTSGRWWWLDESSGLPDLAYMYLIEPDAAGGLWVGTREYGALYMKSFNWVLVDKESGGLVSDEITAILALEDGTTLFAHNEDGISRLNLTAETLPDALQLNNGVPGNTISLLTASPDGMLWMSYRGELHTFNGQQWENYSERNIVSVGESLRGVRSIEISPDGTLWLGMYASSFGSYAHKSLLASWDGNQWTKYTEEDGLIKGEVIEVDFGSDGTVWVLIDNLGRITDLSAVASLRDGTWSVYTSEEGFPAEQPSCLAVDHEDTVWIGTYDIGMLRSNGEDWDLITVEDGLPSEKIYDLFVAENGDLWVATDLGVAIYNGASWLTYTTDDGLADNMVASIEQAEDGAMWFGNKAGASRFDGLNWQTYTAAEGLGGNSSVIAIERAPDGALWFSLYGNGLTRYGPPQQGAR